MASRSTLPISDLELDALTELVNVGVSRAATSLRDMVGKQVALSVPRIELLSCSEAAQTLAEKEPNLLVGIHQSFEGELTGRALLIFPEANSLELVRAVTGGELPLEDIVNLEQEALAETGNIILNNCLATIANMLKRNLRISLPQVVHGNSATIFDLSGCQQDKDAVLFLYIDFNVMDRDIRGYITMLMDLPALETLKSLIRGYIERTTGERPAS
jgi:chemotaxis protein CheC